GRAHEVVGLKVEVLRRFSLQPPFELGAGTDAASKHDISALKHRPHAVEAERGEELAQIGHRDLGAACEIDGPEQRNVDHRQITEITEATATRVTASAVPQRSSSKSARARRRSRAA